MGRVDLAAKLLDDSNNLAHLQKARSSPGREWVYNKRAHSHAARHENAHGIDAEHRSKHSPGLVWQRAQADEEALNAILRCSNWFCQTGMLSTKAVNPDYARELGQQIAYIPLASISALALRGAHCAQRACEWFQYEYPSPAKRCWSVSTARYRFWAALV